jgi:hypothetical protein
MRRPFGSRRFISSLMPASATATSFPALVKFHSATTTCTFSTSCSIFPATILTSCASPFEEHSVTIASSSMSLGFPARFIRAAMQSREWTAQGVTRLQDSFSFDLRRKIRYFLRFQEAAFFIFKITDQTVLSCYFLDRFQIRVPSRLSKARSRRRTNETHHAKRANVFRNPWEGIRLGPRLWPGSRSSKG